MNLSAKATRFVIEAIEHYQREHDERLSKDGLSEDEIADLTNDRRFLDALKKDFEKYREELTQTRKSAQVGA